MSDDYVSIQIPKSLQPAGDHDGDLALESMLSLKPPYDPSGNRVRVVPIPAHEEEKNAKYRAADVRAMTYDPAFNEKGIFSSVEINSLLLNTGEYYTLVYSIPLEQTPANVLLMALCDCLQRGPLVIEYIRFEKLKLK